MFLSKTDEQKLELAQALIRNVALNEKYNNLDTECKILANRIISSQLNRAEEEESKIIIRKELNSLKRDCLKASQQLAIAQNQITSMSSVLEEEGFSMSLASNKEKSMDELLKLKDEMIKCLQEELVEVRLNTAETDCLIRDLKSTEDELKEDDKAASESFQPDTVSNLQDELLAAKMREIEINSAFSKIRNELKGMHKEIKENAEECDGGTKKNNNSDGVVILPNKLALWKSNINEKKCREIQSHKRQIAELENEATSLKNKISDLEIQNRLVKNQLQFRNEAKLKLEQEMLKKNREEELFLDKILEKKHQVSNYEKKANEELYRIQTNKFLKKQTIIEYSKNIEQLVMETEKLTINNNNRMNLNDQTLQKILEDEVAQLQTKIIELKEIEDFYITSKPESCDEYD